MRIGSPSHAMWGEWVDVELTDFSSSQGLFSVCVVGIEHYHSFDTACGIYSGCVCEKYCPGVFREGFFVVAILCNPCVKCVQIWFEYSHKNWWKTSIKTISPGRGWYYCWGQRILASVFNYNIFIMSLEQNILPMFLQTRPACQTFVTDECFSLPSPPVKFHFPCFFFLVDGDSVW